MKIREFNKHTDLEQCVKMGKRQHSESTWSHLPYDAERVKNQYLNSVGNHQYKVFIAEDHGKIVGAAAVVECQYHFSYQTYVQDIFFYLDPAYRRGLTARRLYQRVYNWAKSIGACEVYLNYGFGKENARIEKFYTRMGYEHHSDNYRKAVIE